MVCSASVSALQIVFSNISYLGLGASGPRAPEPNYNQSTVCMTVVQNGRLVRSSKRTGCWCVFSCSAASVAKMATLFSVYRAAVSKDVTAHTNHGKTSSARRNSGQKPKLSVRDCHTLKRIVSKIIELLQQW